MSIRKPSDVTDADLRHLNVHVEIDVNLESLVPVKAFQDRPFLYDADLSSMLSELETDNDDAYREILRQPPQEGRPKPRLAYSRNFFVNLEDMSRYWDNTKDNYYEVEAKEAEEEEEEDQVAGNESQASTAHHMAQKLLEAIKPTHKPSEKPISQPSPETEHQKDLASNTSSTSTTEIPTRPKMKQVYKGQRLGNGEQMSPGTRVSAVRNLLKMAIHKFNCRDFDISGKERLRITTVNLPSVFYNFCVAKVPSEMKLARARMVEGPILAVHARSEVRFKSPDGLSNTPNDFLGEKYDFFRELGCMLMLAKQRAREGKEAPKRDGEDQWWACKARWGGGETRWGQLASEVYEEDDPSWSPEEMRLQLQKREAAAEQQRQTEAAACADLKNLTADDLMANNSTTNERPKKKKRGDTDGGKSRDNAEYKDGRRLMYTQPVRRKWYQEWTKVRPNSATWDEKVIYRRIGIQDREHGGEGWDDVYMLSTVNHHVALLRLSVHEDYLDWLETGGKVDSKNVRQEEPTPDRRQPHMLYLSRSRWYDLFDVEQRKELLTGIWRVMGWLCRDEVPEAEVEKWELLKKQQAAESTDHDMSG